MRSRFPQFTDQQIVAARSVRQTVDSRAPYAFFVEPEFSATRQVVDVATIFLTNRECPFRCLMCDLWKHTLPHSVQPGEIVSQIQFALERLPAASEIKLYNSGNFFDSKAVPVADHLGIARLVRDFDTVVIENHPKLCGDACVRFRDQIAPAQLEIAIGLETCHPELLKTLNKSMTLDDFDSAVERLHREQIRTRAFVLLKLPFLSESESIDWALKSVDYVQQRDVNCCCVIPTRSGNGIMDQLAAKGDFAPPNGRSIEQIADATIGPSQGRVFVDLWDANRFFRCDDCRDHRINRLAKMNRTQQQMPPVVCSKC